MVIIMLVHFSDRMAHMQPSDIREQQKATANPAVVPFTAGNPAIEALPVGDIQRIAAEVLEEAPAKALLYGITEGYDPLREQIAHLLESHYQVPLRDNKFIVTTGAQQAADLSSKVVLNENDVVICENPSFPSYMKSFQSYNATVIGIDTEKDGIDISQLEKALQTHKNVKLLYLMPNFQNPTGYTTSLAKRKEILQLCKKHEVLILEDNPYGDLRYTGEDVPLLKSLDTDGIVFYVGSFSKILSPGLRLGYVLGPGAYIDKMTIAKQICDSHTPMLTQMICAKWLATTDLTANIARIREIYKQKLDCMLRHMEATFPPAVHYSRPEGGMFVWCTLPEQADLNAFCAEALKRNVAVVSGRAFTANTAPCTSFRINFTAPSEEQIVRGIEALGKLTHELYR